MLDKDADVVTAKGEVVKNNRSGWRRDAFRWLTSTDPTGNVYGIWEDEIKLGLRRLSFGHKQTTRACVFQVAKSPSHIFHQ
jgi:hypothetical protein